MVYNALVKNVFKFVKYCALYVLCLTGVLFSVVSCKKVETERITTQEELPDMVLTDATYTFGEAGRTPIIMTASKITIYSKEKDKTVLVDIKFEQMSQKKENQAESSDNTEENKEKDSSIPFQTDTNKNLNSNASTSRTTSTEFNTSNTSVFSVTTPVAELSNSKDTSFSNTTPVNSNNYTSQSNSKSSTQTNTKSALNSDNSLKAAQSSLTNSNSITSETVTKKTDEQKTESARNNKNNQNSEETNKQTPPTGFFADMSGSCKYAEITKNNSLATLRGDIVLEKKSDNFRISCNELIWDNDKQTISTDGIVNVTYENNTTIRARGFTAKLNENVYEFKNIIEGTYSSEK